MTTSYPNSLETRQARAVVLGEFLNSRILDEISHEASRYHHEACGLNFSLPDCSCDGPERTREQLEVILALVQHIADQPQPTRAELALMEKAGTIYADHANFPVVDSTKDREAINEAAARAESSGS